VGYKVGSGVLAARDLGHVFGELFPLVASKDAGSYGAGLSESRALAANTARELEILGHDGDPLRVHGTEVRVLEQGDEVGFARFLECQDGRGLEAQISLEVRCDLANEALERELADEEVRCALVAANFAQRLRARAEPVRLLDTRRWRRLPRNLRSQLLPRGLASSTLASRLLGPSHRGGNVKMNDERWAGEGRGRHTTANMQDQWMESALSF